MEMDFRLEVYVLFFGYLDIMVILVGKGWGIELCFFDSDFII